MNWRVSGWFGAKFASRNYDYQLEGGRLLRVVNDATIAKDATSRGKVIDQRRSVLS